MRLLEHLIYSAYAWIRAFMSFSEFSSVDNGLLAVVARGNSHDTLNNDSDYSLGLQPG